LQSFQRKVVGRLHLKNLLVPFFCNGQTPYLDAFYEHPLRFSERGMQREHRTKACTTRGHHGAQSTNKSELPLSVDVKMRSI